MIILLFLWHIFSDFWKNHADIDDTHFHLFFDSEKKIFESLIC